MLFILRTLVEWRRTILTTGVAAAAIMAIVSFLLPKWYTASTSVFPPEPQGMLPAYASIVQNLQLPILGPNAVGARPGTIYIEILKSRSLGERIVEEFDLQSVYGEPLLSETVNLLHKHTTYTLMENGLLVVQFDDQDPDRAAAIANRYVELLDEFNRGLNVARAGKTREFISRQLDSHTKDLAAAEEALREFQEQHQALELTEQVRSAIEVVSTLTAEAISLEVELDILGQYAARTSEEYKRTRRRYDGVVEQLKKFKQQGTRDDNDVVRSFFPTLENVPEVTLEFARRLRRVKIEEKVYELLIQEYEKARIEEARDTPTLQILDPATVPELRTRPKRKLLVVVAGVMGVGWSAVIVVLMAMWRQNEGREGFRSVIDPVLSDFRRLRRRSRD